MSRSATQPRSERRVDVVDGKRDVMQRRLAAVALEELVEADVALLRRDELDAGVGLGLGEQEADVRLLVGDALDGAELQRQERAPQLAGGTDGRCADGDMIDAEDAHARRD